MWETSELQSILRGDASKERRRRNTALATDILRKAELEVERLKSEGWNKAKFATELESLLNEKKSEDH